MSNHADAILQIAARLQETAGAGLGAAEQHNLGQSLRDALKCLRTEHSDQVIMLNARLISALWAVPKEALLPNDLQEDLERAQRLLELEASQIAQRDNAGPQPPCIEDIVGIGWRATLHSGGTIMTVVNYVVVDGALDRVDCVWHDDKSRPCEGSYPAQALRIVPPQSGA